METDMRDWTRASATTRERRLIADIEESCAQWDDGQSSILSSVTPRIGELLGFDIAVSYQLAEAESGLAVPFLAAAGSTPARSIHRRLAEFVRDKQVGWSAYNPLMPQVAQRNRALTLPQVERLEPGAREVPVARLMTSLGMFIEGQLRALLCDGPSLLSFVGGYRAEPYSKRDLLCFGAVLPAIRRRLMIERQLGDAALSLATMDVALELTSRAAFVTTAFGATRYTNSAGARLLSEDAQGTRERLRRIARGLGEPGWQRIAIRSPGLNLHFLVVGADTSNTVEARVAFAAKLWQLTAAQERVLRCLVQGDANKTMAARLRRAVRTIEVHVTALLRKAEVESRAALVAKVLSLR